MITDEQNKLIDLYVATYPSLAELAERARKYVNGHVKTLGDAMAMKPYPPGVTGTDAWKISKIGMPK